MDRKVARVKTTCGTTAAVMAVCREFISAVEAAVNGRPISAGPTEPPSAAAADLVEWANAELNARHCAHVAGGVNVEVRLDNARVDRHGWFVGTQVPKSVTLWVAGQSCRHWSATFTLGADGRPESAVAEWTAYGRDMTTSDGEFVSASLCDALDAAGEEYSARGGILARDAGCTDKPQVGYGYVARY